MSALFAIATEAQRARRSVPKRDKGASGSGAETNCPRLMARLCDSTRGQGRPLGVWVTDCVGLPMKVDPAWCRERRPAISLGRNRKSQRQPGWRLNLGLSGHRRSDVRPPCR